jgi:hypothetical protein
MAHHITSKFFFPDAPESEVTGDRATMREERKARFLERFGAVGWRRACEEAGCTMAQVVAWMRADPEFREAHRLASEETAARLEAVVDAIATGEIDATPTQLQAAQFRLRGLRPEVYAARVDARVDATTRTVGEGDSARARIMLAEWVGPAAGSIGSAGA